MAEDKNKVGRKWFDGKDEEATLTKCKEVWAIGGSDAEASFYAEVSTASLSRYLDAHPAVKEIRNALHEKPILKARQAVVKGLDNYQNAMDYLKRKKRKEFGDSHDLTSGGNPININFDGAFNSSRQTETDSPEQGEI